MPLWLMIVIGIVALLLGRVAVKAISEYRYNRMIERRLQASLQQYRDAGYTNDELQIVVEHGVALVRVIE